MQVLLEMFFDSIKNKRDNSGGKVIIPSCISNSMGGAENDDLWEKGDNANSSLRQEEKSNDSD
jgi:hypothetical protein